jgi:hypothetical protein
MQNTSSSELKAHPFELAGLGTGPYRFVGMVSIPGPSLAEANPEAYNNALRELPRDLVGGCGTCSCCGMAIMNICIVVNGQGQRYGIGSDCVLKTGDAYLGNPAKIAIAKHQRHQRAIRNAAKRAAKHKVWLATVCNEAGETNSQRLDRESLEREGAEKALKAQQAVERTAATAKFGFLLPYLSGPEGGFCESIAKGIRQGYPPRVRAVDICGEIYAKAHGRRGSKAYNEALDEFGNLTAEQEAK